MCGIIGLISKKNTHDANIVISMRDAIWHRGPDDAGYWQSSDGTVFFAHQRLSVIDLSSAGHQPMLSSDGRFSIVFNGEIYNFIELRDELSLAGHNFKTQSDTEVIIEAYRRWGELCVKRLNGMFSFAIYDNHLDLLFAARDRAGEKPLFYWHNGNTLIFASELKALMVHPMFPRSLDMEAMNFYLAYGYIPWDKCILRGVKKLPQGHTMLFERCKGLLTTRAYWSLPTPLSVVQYDEKKLVHEFKQLLTRAVQEQLVADVPVGILLSGGIDSSLITAIASQISQKPIKTFTISFPGYSNFDEAPYAQIIADYFCTDHTVIPAEPASLNLLPELAVQYDEPLADSSMIPTFLISRKINQYTKVAIGGDGGDELFAGYPHYSYLLLQESASRYFPSWMRSFISSIANTLLPLGFRGRSYLLGLEGNLKNSFAFVNQLFDYRSRLQLFKPFRETKPDFLLSPERFKSLLAESGKTLIQNATAIDFMTYLVDDILVKVDRASMATSLEVRSPFLDHRMIEFAFSKVPDSLRIKGYHRKILPRLLSRGLLPSELPINRKQGLVIPLTHWFKGKWGDFIKSILFSNDSWFNQNMISKLIVSQEHGFANTQRLFALLIFELWRKSYNITLQ